MPNFATTRPVRRVPWRHGGVVLATLTLAFAGSPLLATSLRKTDLVDLISHSDTIVAGRVEKVADGFDPRGIPYTEITLKVGQRIRGEIGEKEYTFRQFGLLQPHPLPGGRTNVSVVPDGWARFGVGEDVALFLGAPASQTGLRTTVGLRQGKLSVVNGKIKRDSFNAGLFDGVTFAPGVLGSRHQGLVKKAQANQDIEVDAFLDLVRQALAEEWIGKGRMKHAR
jgi:hypothetical protein